MRNRWFPFLTAIMAGALWVTLGLLVNTRLPSTPYQIIFVALVGAALAFTVMPVSHLLQTRQESFLYMTPPWRNALRQGAIVGAWGSALVALRLVGALNVTSGVLLSLLAASCELLAWLRRRR